MRRLIVTTLLAVVAGLFFVGSASAQEVYVQPPGNTPTAGETDTGTPTPPASQSSSTPRASGDSEGTRVLGVQFSRGEDERLMFAATGGDVVGLVLLGGGLLAAGYVLRRRSVSARLA